MKNRAKHPNSYPRPVMAFLSFGLAAGLAFTAARADGPFLMPTGTTGAKSSDPFPFDDKPGEKKSITNKVLVYGTDPDGVAVPKKTVRITNNTDQTVYPIMRDPNSALQSNNKTGLYDPFDLPNKEYRGYIGYKEGEQYYFGLKKGDSITVTIPLVFWNGARIGIGTDGKYLTVDSKGFKPNPTQYDVASVRSITLADKYESTANPNLKGVVMWYRSDDPLLGGPNEDTEDQLAEWTIRDHAYLMKISAKSNYKEVPDNQLLDLINHDVSNVDSLYLPVAMEANDVWILPQGSGTGKTPNKDGWKAGSNPAPFGWTGAINPISYLQDAIREFTDLPNNGKNALLGDYFGGKGWPFYNFPNAATNPDQPKKIPSGANVFAQSPLKNVTSSYTDGVDWQTNKYLLSSGGTGPKLVNIGWSGSITPMGSSTLALNPNALEKKKFDAIKVGDFVTVRPSGTAEPFPNGKVLNILPASTSVVLDTPLKRSSENCGYDFGPGQHDYASEAMIRLWYSWADYYQQHWKDKNPQAPTAPTQIKGNIKEREARIYFNEPHKELVPGMSVTGPGLDEAMTEVDKHQGDAVILKVSSDGKSVLVSQVATKNSNNTFTFSPPKALLYTPKTDKDPGYPLIKNLSFTKEDEWRNSYEFAQTVYLIMASMNQIGQYNNNYITKFMQNIIGANMGYIYDQKAKDSDDGKMLMATIRDMIKSALRGVSDFTKYPDVVDSSGNHLHWYPNPKEPTGGQLFNVFNLDPFVWFVHVRLKFSGYGFSVDDDTADIGAGGATQLQINVTGLNGMKNSNPWTAQAPYGPVTVSGVYSGTGKESKYLNISDATKTTPITITSAGLHNLKEDTVVTIEGVKGNTAANGTRMVKHLTPYTFELYSEDGQTPIASNGQYDKSSTARWGYPLHVSVETGPDLTKAFHKLYGDEALGSYEGAFLNTVDGKVPDKAPDGKRIRIWQRGREDIGSLLLNAPIKINGQLLPAGTYTFVFSGS